MKKITFLAVTFFVSLIVSAQSSDIQKILKLQDERASSDQFIPFLNSKNTELISRALEAFGSIQDSTAIDLILPFLKSEEKQIRLNAAFALGQIGKQKTSVQLEKSLLTENDSEVFEETARAFGRTADLKQMEILPYRFEKWETNQKFLTAYSEILLRASIRQISSDSLILRSWWTANHSEDETVIWKSLYALSRFKKSKEFNAKLEDADGKFETSKNPYIRMYWASVFGNSPDTLMAVEKLGKWLQSEKDPRVKVNIIRSLGKYPTFQSINYLFSVSSDEIGYVQSAVQSVLMNSAAFTNDQITKDAIVVFVDKRLNSVKGEPTKSDIDWLMLGYKLKPDLKHVLLEKVKNHSNPVLRSNFPLFLSLSENYDHLTTLENLIRTEPMIVKTSALTAWLTLGKKRVIFPKEQIKPVIQYAFSTKDMAMITLAADALKDSVFRYDNFENDLISLIKTLDAVNDVEAIQSILQTMGEVKNPLFVPALKEFSSNKYSAISSVARQSLSQITGEKFVAESIQTKPDYTDYNWKYLSKWWGGVDVIVSTTKGEFRMRMMTQRAPFTVMSFMRLIEKRFYSGLYFHRVVPNFVVQGGDPRGDGWGGPGYAIRSEFSTVRYSDEGFVGVASAGKDTEGCQLFVVHSATPHLDGRYTIFANVVSGMDVVQKLEVGDRIISISVKE